MDVVKKVQNSFSNDFLNAYYDSSSVGRGVSIAWSILTMGGSVPLDVLETQFPRLKEELSEVDILIKAGLLRWEGTGSSNAGSGNSTVMLIISDRLGGMLLKSGVDDLDFNKFKSVIIKNFGSSLAKEYKIDEASLPIASVLASVLEAAGPNTPAFINTVLVAAGQKNNIGENSFRIYKDILEYYLNYSMGLVQFDRFKVNLTEKAQTVIKKDKELWDMYNTAAKNIPQSAAPEEKENPKEEISPEEPKREEKEELEKEEKK